MKANLENLYHLIRKEDVVLWTGAGFSKYAGYPTGSELARIIYDSCTASEKKEIGKVTSLDDLTEKYIRIKNGSRHQLNEILLRVFKMEPISNEWHREIVNIPHFNTIITTNYDTLFESVYPPNYLTSCWRDDQIPYIENSPVTLLKIHGCLSDLSSVIISRSDYATIMRRNLTSPFWSTLIKSLSTKTILFIGYGYEDPNIWQIFDIISESLGPNKKQAFFITPSIKQHDIANLQRKGITVLKQKAQIFLQGLRRNINDNIISDFGSNEVSLPTFTSVLSKHNLSALISTTTKGPEIKSIEALNGNINGEIKFTLKDKRNSTLMNELMRDDVERIDIIADQVKSFEMTLEGLKMPLSKDNMAHLSITNNPLKEITFDIRFPKKSFELLNLKGTIYRKINKLKIVVNYETSILEVFVSTDDLANLKVSVNYSLPEVFTNVTIALNTFNLFYHMATSEKFQIYLKESDSTQNMRFPNGAPQELQNDIEQMINYFTYLKDIETFYGRRFTKIEHPNSKDINAAKKIVDALSGDRMKIASNDEVIMDTDLLNDNWKELLLNSNSPRAIRIIHQEETIVTLHDLDFPIGFQRTEFIMEKVTNFADVIAGATTALRVKVLDSAKWISYVKSSDDV